MLRTTFEKLRNRFGMTKILIVSGIALVISVSLIANGISGAVQTAKLNDTISSAERFLKQGDWLSARQAVEKLKPELPASVPQPSIESLTVRINELEKSEQSFDRAESLSEEGNYNASIVEYLKVLATDTARYEIAVKKITALEPLAIQDALLQGRELSSNQKFQDAISLLDRTIELVGPDSRLSAARTVYIQSRTAQAQAQIAETKRLRTVALSKMRKKRDSFESITWYRDFSSPTYANNSAFYLYFGSEGSTKYTPRLVVRYFDDDWLFVNEARVNVDGEIYTLSCSDWERDNNSDVWEWCDMPMDDRGMIEAIIKSKKAVIRFDGDKYYDTRTISSTQKQALRNVLKAYDAF